MELKWKKIYHISVWLIYRFYFLKHHYLYFRTEFCILEQSLNKDIDCNIQLYYLKKHFKFLWLPFCTAKKIDKETNLTIGDKNII